MKKDKAMFPPTLLIAPFKGPGCRCKVKKSLPLSDAHHVVCHRKGKRMNPDEKKRDAQNRSDTNKRALPSRLGYTEARVLLHMALSIFSFSLSLSLSLQVKVLPFYLSLWTVLRLRSQYNSGASSKAHPFDNCCSPEEDIHGL